MRFALAYAGVPRDFYDRVYAERNTFIGKAQYFGRPLVGKGITYDAEHINECVNFFAGLICQDHYNELSDTAFAVIAINHDPESTSILRQALFPSIYCATVNWSPTRGSPMQLKMGGNSLIAALREATRKVKTALALLGDEVVARSNTTPLLLPVKNFSSTMLEPQLQLLHNNLHRVEDQNDFIRKVIGRIKHAHPFERVNDSPKRAFVDDRKIIFGSPGHERHAFARPSSDHPISCILAGKRRLGAPYDHAFHYDCTKSVQAHLQGSFYGCHEPRAEHTGNPHLNIAPNDFIRK